jgi:hypothetical protein
LSQDSQVPPELVRIEGADVERLARDFESYLTEAGVRINPSSELRVILDDALAFGRVHCSAGLPEGHSYESYHASAQSAVMWAQIVLRTKDTDFESQMKERLRLLGKGDPAMVRPGKSSRQRNLLFELRCACALARTVPGVRLVEPPDVALCHADLDWGLACKVAYGSHDQIADAVQVGVGQVERAQVDGGLVVVDMTSVFPHADMSPHLPDAPEFPATLRSGVEAYEYAVSLLEPTAVEVVGRLRLRESQVRKTHGIVFMGHTSCRILGAPSAFPFFLGQLIPDRQYEREAMQLCELLKNGNGA